jgi:signal transduction histidine kinase
MSEIAHLILAQSNQGMNTGAPAQPSPLRPRPEDVAWLVLFVSLALASPTDSDAEWPLLGAMAVFQIAEPRFAYFSTRNGVLAAIAVKMALSFLLIGYTGGIASSHFLILIVPVVAAATSLGGWGTFAVSAAAGAAYVSFLLFLDWSRYTIPPDQVREICLRLLMIAMMALLTHQLAAATRNQYRQYVETAAKLELAESAARRSERLAALGQLTAGLAHELRNPLGTMKASAEMLAKSLPDGSEVPRELAGYIASEVDRTNSLVTRFLDFARPLQLRRAEADLNAVIDSAIDRLQRDGQSSVSIHRNYSPDLPRFALDAELMERVFYNLILNAAQASPPGGAITVRTRAEGKSVEAAVIDRGSGIDPAHRESIFNPFFTTKPEGVGLGLAIVAKIVSEHGGKVGVESEKGQGSSFRVLLPIA